VRITRWAARAVGTLALLSVVAVLAGAPASATTKRPPGYVLNSAEWCDFDAYKRLDIDLGSSPGTLHLRARHNMSNGHDGICAYVTDDVAGSHWINLRVKASAWTASAWDAGVFTTYAGALGVHAVVCFDRVYGEVTVNGVTSSALYTQLWCST
jgi:hypothetical protein